MTRAVDVAKILQLNGGELVGKTRLQKTFYFLERYKLGFDFDFHYHHYGPYSDELATATQDAIALSLVRQEWNNGTQAQPYASFSIVGDIHPDSSDDSARIRILRILSRYDAITLELAATADFLKVAGYEDEWKETSVRKASKASPDRLAKAKILLSELAT